MIDSFSWLCNTKDKKHVGERFITWVDDWLLPTGYPECSAKDLYGARCGLNHRLTGESDLFDKGQAKRIIYTYGKENTDFIDSLRTSFPEHPNIYALNLNKFLNAIDKAMTNCFTFCMKDERLKKSLMAKIDSIYVDVDLGNA